MQAPVVEVLTLTLQAGAAADEPMKALFGVLGRQKGYQGGYWGRWEELEDKIQLFIRVYTSISLLASHLRFLSPPRAPASLSPRRVIVY